jgi:hypothetical protein
MVIYFRLAIMQMPMWPGFGTLRCYVWYRTLDRARGRLAYAAIHKSHSRRLTIEASFWGRAGTSLHGDCSYCCDILSILGIALRLEGPSFSELIPCIVFSSSVK